MRDITNLWIILLPQMSFLEGLSDTKSKKINKIQNNKAKEDKLPE